MPFPRSFGFIRVARRRDFRRRGRTGTHGACSPFTAPAWTSGRSSLRLPRSRPAMRAAGARCPFAWCPGDNVGKGSTGRPPPHLCLQEGPAGRRCWGRGGGADCFIREVRGARKRGNAHSNQCCGAGGRGKDSDLDAPTLRGRQRGPLDRGRMCLDPEGPATLNRSPRARERKKP